MTEHSGWGTPVWHDREAPSYPPLTQDLDVEVLVIGAGIAGVSTAWELARAGVEVALIDAGTIGGGTTGATTAKVSALQGTTYQRIARVAGADRAREYADGQMFAVQHLAGIVSRLKLDCDLVRRPSWLFAETRKGVAALEREVEAAQDAGLSVVTGKDPGLPFPVEASACLDDQIMFHPLRYLDGLVADLVAQRAQVFEHTTAVDLENGDPHLVRTNRGRAIRARHVVVATHFPVFESGLLFARLKCSREFVLAGPVPGLELPDMYVGVDSEMRSLRPARTEAEGDVVLVSGSHFLPGAADPATRLDDLRLWAATHLERIELSHSWAAQDSQSPDGLPFIGSFNPAALRAPRLWGATGFGGWGMTNGVLAGVLIRDHVTLDEGASWGDAFRVNRGSVGIKGEVPRVIGQGKRFVEGFVGARVASQLSRKDLTDLAPGESARSTRDLGSVVGYRDLDGKLHVVSAVCTHMGCLVELDPVEEVWACPCHGSRFGLDGAVHEGPAVEPLTSYDD